MGALAGIVGEEVEAGQVSKMLLAMHHRGPDNSVIKRLANGTVGCTQLVTSAQRTAGFNGEQEPFVLLDGELYNERDSTISDVSLLRSLFLEHGKNCFSLLHGSYTCAIIDENEMILARDPVGSRSLFYGNKDNTLYFASEAKALVEHLPRVEELVPGNYYSSVYGVRPLARFSPNVPEFENTKQATRTIQELLVGAVERQMSDGAAHGIALSGGLDSSIIAVIAKEFNPNLKLFSCTVERSPSQDIGYAKQMARYLGLDHKIYAISNEDIATIIPTAIRHLESFDEDCVSGFVANYYTSRLVAEETNCALVGEGGDELFGGYFAELPDTPGRSKKELMQMLVDIAYNTALRRLDRGWLANSVNYRTPFLDPALIKFSNKIPMDLKVRYDHESGISTEKWILRQAFSKQLPEAIRDRAKMRFARGVGIDDLMDEATAIHVGKKDLETTPTTSNGIKLHSPKELYYYRLFNKHFPKGYESLTARWDPFK